MSVSKDTLAAARKYTKESMAGAGAVKGVPCQIKSVVPTTGGNNVTYLWVDNDGNPHETVMFVKDGAKGDKGDKGDRGEVGPQGAQGPQGPQGVGLPEGGTAGQMLIKDSGADYDYSWHNVGTAVQKDATDVVRPGNRALVESNAVFSAISIALSSVYTPHGDLTCAELTADLLIAANVGNVYNMTDAGTTSALFIQGAGTTISIGDSVGIIKAGSDEIMFNYMGNVFDLTDYQKKELTTPLIIGGQSQTDVEGALGALNTTEATDIQDVYEANGITGAKNLLPMPYYMHTHSIAVPSGFAVTYNADGSVLGNGTIPSDYSYDYYTIHITERYSADSNIFKRLPAGKYIFSITCDKSDPMLVSIGYLNGSSTTWLVGDSEFTDSFEYELNITEAMRDYGWSFQVKFKKSQTYSAQTFYPMIRIASDTDKTFQRFAPVNKDVLSYKNNAILGAKNLLYIVKGTLTHNGVVFTPYVDGHIHVQGTIATTGNAIYAFTLYDEYPKDLPSGMYIISGRPKTVSGPTAYIRVSVKDSGAVSGPAYDDALGNGKAFPYIKGQQMQFAIIIYGTAGQSINTDFWPMLRVASDEDPTFEKFAMTNKQLTGDMMHSTSETDTGKIWIDGKKIYRKVVAITTSSSASGNQSTNLGISNIDKVIKSSCSVKRPNTNDAYYPLPFIWGSGSIGYWINTANNSFISIQSSNVASSELSLEGYLIIEYTKTT